MPSNRSAAAVVAAAVAHAHALGTPTETATHQAVLDAAAIYQQTSGDGVARCAFCDREVRPHEIGSFRKVEGWAEVRRAGGTHALSDQRPTGEVACGECMTARRLGFDPMQGALSV